MLLSWKAYLNMFDIVCNCLMELLRKHNIDDFFFHSNMCVPMSLYLSCLLMILDGEIKVHDELGNDPVYQPFY